MIDRVAVSFRDVFMLVYCFPGGRFVFGVVSSRNTINLSLMRNCGKKTGFTRVPQVLTINMLCVNAQWKSMVKIKTSGFHLETSNYIYKLAATSFVWYITFPYTFLTVALPTGPSMWNQVYRCSRILLHSHMHVPTQTHTRQIPRKKHHTTATHSQSAEQHRAGGMIRL